MSTTTANGRAQRTSLAQQIDRLDLILDNLSEGLQEAVAEAVKIAVTRAVEAAVVARKRRRVSLLVRMVCSALCVGSSNATLLLFGHQRYGQSLMRIRRPSRQSLGQVDRLC